MRHLSIRPAFTFRGRTWKGLRGWSGKPLHPPLTDIPVGAYVLAAVLDVISVIGGEQATLADHPEAWSFQMYRAATYALALGAAVSVLAALTGLMDLLKST